METITARFIWTANDLLDGRNHALKLSKWSSVRIWLLALVGFTIPILIFRPPNSKHEFLAVAFLFFTFVIGIIIGVPLAKMISQWSIRRQFAKRPDAESEVVWQISEKSISIHSDQLKAEIQWSAFQRVVFTPLGFLFMPNAQIFHFFPNRAFANDGEIAKLKELVRRLAKDLKELK